MTAKKHTPSERVLRVNASATPGHIAPSKSAAAPASMKRQLGGIYKGQRPRREGEAGSVSHSTLHDPETYRTGMGEMPAVNRPGSDVAHRLPSKGIST